MTILTIDQFEAACKLLNLLENLGVQKAELVHANLIEQEGDDWAVCDNCMELVSECGRQCSDDSLHGRYYAEYDDEASASASAARMEWLDCCTSLEL